MNFIIDEIVVYSTYSMDIRCFINTIIKYHIIFIMKKYSLGLLSTQCDLTMEGAALATNAAYARLFTQLALGSLATGALMWAARPWLRQLIDGTPAR
ncbi:MAG: hypothetical protein K2X12_12105 [Burkholderiaceae bacterium]|nr:hypothetical protein [Burkholderiaceae bacterium]